MTRAGRGPEVEGTFDARGRRFAVFAARFNDLVTTRLLDGAVACFRAHGLADEDVTVAWAPGSFELPVLAEHAARSGRYDAVVCLGAVIRGETTHYELVSEQAAAGIQRVALDTGVPVIFGVLTTENLEQALARAGGKLGNKGWDAAVAAMQMASVLERLPVKD